MGHYLPQWKSFAGMLREGLSRVELLALSLIDASEIRRRRQDRFAPLIVLPPPHDYAWAKLSDEGRRFQMDALREYRAWHALFAILYPALTADLRDKADRTHRAVTLWLQRNRDNRALPATTAEAKERFKTKLSEFTEVLELCDHPDRRGLVAIPDTNALTDCPDVARYGEVLDTAEFTVLLVPAVLSELDLLKVTARSDAYRKKVRGVIGRIKEWRRRGDATQGVKVAGKVTLRTEAREPDFSSLPRHLDPTVSDDRILGSMLEALRAAPWTTVVLITGDVNLQTKADALRLPYTEPPEDGDSERASEGPTG